MPDGVFMGKNSVAKGDSWQEILFIVGSDFERLSDFEEGAFVKCDTIEITCSLVVFPLESEDSVLGGGRG